MNRIGLTFILEYSRTNIYFFILLLYFMKVNRLINRSIDQSNIQLNIFFFQLTNKIKIKNKNRYGIIYLNKQNSIVNTKKINVYIQI